MVHRVFDIGSWEPVFPLKRLREEARRYVNARKEEVPKEYRSIGSVERHIIAMSPGGELPGHFLCVMGSIDPQPYANRIFPFINVQESSSVDDDAYLEWGDVGSLYIFLTVDNDLHWVCQYY